MLAPKFGVVPGPASLKDAPSQRDALPTTGLRRRSHTVVTGGWYRASYTGFDAAAILVIALIVVACQDKLLASGSEPPAPTEPTDHWAERYTETPGGSSPHLPL